MAAPSPPSWSRRRHREAAADVALADGGHGHGDERPLPGARRGPRSAHAFSWSSAPLGSRRPSRQQRQRPCLMHPWQRRRWRLLWRRFGRRRAAASPPPPPPPSEVLWDSGRARLACPCRDYSGGAAGHGARHPVLPLLHQRASSLHATARVAIFWIRQKYINEFTDLSFTD